MNFSACIRSSRVAFECHADVRAIGITPGGLGGLGIMPQPKIVDKMLGRREVCLPLLGVVRRFLDHVPPLSVVHGVAALGRCIQQVSW